jgi:hypothetical protein
MLDERILPSQDGRMDGTGKKNNPEQGCFFIDYYFANPDFLTLLLIGAAL